jgi:glycerate 2-kinase
LVQDQVYRLDDYKRVFIIGSGKASQAMASEAAAILGSYLTKGLIIVKHQDGALFDQRITVVNGGHPLPDQNSLESTQKVMQFVRGLHEDDLVITLLSGGASALMSLPVQGVTLADLQVLTRELLVCGATINEINCLRKHLDQVKGGRLAGLIYPAKLITLILSDVVGSPLDVIASGPATSDPSTYAEAIAVLKKYEMMNRVPASITSVLVNGDQGRLEETLKKDDQRLASVRNIIVGDNTLAAKAAVRQAQQEGYHSLLLTTYLQGEASQTGKWLASILKQVAASGDPQPRPCCLVCGGETTVTLKGQGKGGRNQEAALGAVEGLNGLENVALVTLATDGEDGPTDAAGAVVTGSTAGKARQAALSTRNALADNDSYTYFEKLGDLIKTGPTGTNVNDLVFLFAF